MTAKKWVRIFVTLLLAAILAMTAMVVVIDPFFHYHKPLNGLYYNLNEERYQNDGILRNFDYDAMITGTSMTQNFKASQADDLWGYDFIKVCYSGAMYKEINDAVELALKDHDVRMVVRAIDGTYLLEDKDAARNDLGSYPEYLYDANPFNDVKYIFNSTVIGNYCLPMLGKKILGQSGGITSFDDYSNWMAEASYGAEAVLTYRTSFTAPESEETTLTDAEKKTLKETVAQNITSTAAAHPDVQFYYFFPPYSAAYWGTSWEKGTMKKEFACYRLAAEEMLQYDNIHLFAFDDRYDLTVDLNNYRDISHYCSWINETILSEMAEGNGRLTQDNCSAFYDGVEAYYDNFDFNSLIPEGYGG